MRLRLRHALSHVLINRFLRRLCENQPGKIVLTCKRIIIKVGTSPETYFICPLSTILTVPRADLFTRSNKGDLSTGQRGIFTSLSVRRCSLQTCQEDLSTLRLCTQQKTYS